MTWVKPMPSSSCAEEIGWFSSTFAPMARTRASSLSMAAEGMRNSGIRWRTTPPSLPVASKMVTGTPSRPSRKAAAIPAGPPAHHGHVPVVTPRLWPEPGQQGVIAPLGGGELLVTDMYALLIGAPHALVRAVVGADGAGDKGQGIALKDNLQGLLIFALPHQRQVGGDVLVDGAALPAGGGEAACTDCP